MRYFVIASILASISVARADDTKPVAMTTVKDLADVCKRLVADLDPKATCTSAGKLAVKGGVEAETYVAKGGMVRYAVVVTANKVMYLSPPVEIMPMNCGMSKCDVLDDNKTTLRTLTINNVSIPALVIDKKFHHEVTNEKGKQDTTEKWTSTSVIACSGSAKGGPACSVREWGGRGNSCKVTVKPDGNVLSNCDATDYIAVE